MKRVYQRDRRWENKPGNNTTAAAAPAKLDIKQYGKSIWEKDVTHNNSG